MTGARGLAARLFVAGAVAMVVVGATGIAPLLSGLADGGVEQGPAHPEWSVDAIAPDRLESSGETDPRGDVGTVVIDDTHGSRMQEEELRSLTRAIEDGGGDVVYPAGADDMESTLHDADVLVVADPASPYTAPEIRAIRQFVRDGGRLLLLGEPNRNALRSQGLGSSLVTQRSRLTQLGSAFGISFGSQYLYDMETNDGNFKNVVTSPPDGADHQVVEGVDRVTLYTAASVEVNRGTVLLRTAPTAERAHDGTNGGFPVAVLTADGGVLAVGDTTFLASHYHAVADNDVFVQRIVEFMADADHQPSGSPPADTPVPPDVSAARPSG